MNKARWERDPDTGLYAVVVGESGLTYEAQFTYREVRRLVACENHADDLTWDECREYVEGNTNERPWLRRNRR